MTDSAADQELADRYAAYLGVCNAHDFDRLGESVAADLRVDGMPTGLPAYAARVAGVVEPVDLRAARGPVRLARGPRWSWRRARRLMLTPGPAAR